MEREELLSKINEKLGSTKLSLSEKTMNDFAADTLAGITDDAQLTDDFLERKVSFLKSLDGNLHYDVSKQVELYKKNYKPEQKQEEGGDGLKSDNELKEKFTKLEDRFNEIVELRKKEKEAAEKAVLVDKAVETMKEKFKKADVGVNGYVLRQTLRDIEVKGDEKAADLAEAIETEYFKGLKDAGIDYDSPMGGNLNVANKGAENAKSRREALKRELASRGYIPKKEN